MPTVTVLEADGTTETDIVVNDNGRAAATASKPVVLSTEDKAALDAITAALADNATGADIATVVSALSGVELGATSLAALETIELGATSLAALESVTATVTGVATSAKQDSQTALLTTIDAALAGTIDVAIVSGGGGGGGDATAANQDEQTALLTTIDTKLGGSLAVTGTFWQATQPVSIAGTVAVSGPLTDTQLRATAVPVSGTFWQATQPVSAASLPLPTGAATSSKQDDTITAINALVGSEYETVAASQTNQALGAAGAAGDLLQSILVIPATTSPGAVQIKDGAGSAITVFAGGASSVSTLHPFPIPLGIRSSAGAWQVTTGANVSVIAAGNFT